MLSWWSCPEPVAHSCSLLNHPNSFCWGMFKLNAKFDTDSLLYWLSQFECVGHTIHMLTQWHLLPPHWLVQWSHHCSCTYIPVHSPWLPSYINDAQNPLIILTMAGLFLDRPHGQRSVDTGSRGSDALGLKWDVRSAFWARVPGYLVDSRNTGLEQ